MDITNRHILMAMAVGCGCIVFVVGHVLVSSGTRIYQQSFVQRVGLGLKESFIFIDPRTLFVLNMVALIVAALVGSQFLGGIGTVFTVAAVAACPTLLLRYMRHRRAKRFVYQLPDSLNSISSALRAGTNLSRAMEQVAARQPAPLSEEFSVVLSEYRMGRKLEESLDDMYQRIRQPELDLFNSAVSISRSVGGNLADTLDSLSETLREKAQVEGKVAALTAMGRMQGLVACLLPVLVAFVISKQEPESMKALFTEPAGWIAVSIITVMMTLAIIFIRKIVNIDV